jgi:hypothetical protein
MALALDVTGLLVAWREREEAQGRLIEAAWVGLRRITPGRALIAARAGG